MNSRLFRPRPLAAAVATAVAAAALGASSTLASTAVTDSPTARAAAVSGPGSPATARYIVRFEEQPLATYNQSAAHKPVNGISQIPSKTFKNGRTRLDVGSPQAKAYVGYLKQQQAKHLGDIAGSLGHAPAKTYAMQHALNAVILRLSPAEAQKIAKVPGVVAVERDRPQPLATDLGPGFIGASSLWWGTPAGQDTVFASGFDSDGGYRGDGIVIGDIDTGYNSLSPSFQATDASGYTITNPLGTGTFLGQCNVPGISLAGCNDKVIGVYDEIGLTTNPLPTTFSVEDTQGHGSHTASTAGGNARSATLLGYTAPISGVAPHANLVIYYACSPDETVLCSSAATSASVDQAVADGVVDALNYSISGGTTPWTDSTSLAFLAAEDAGIFIAAAAGNGTAVPGSVNHVEPWVATIAAANHTGGALDQYLSVTGPGSPPVGVQHDTLTSADGDTPATGTITHNLVLSPYFHNSDTNGDDGCGGPAPDGDNKVKRYPHNAFAGSIALISRGTCSFYVKVENAVAAGAVAVVIADNRPEGAFTALVTDATTNARQTVPVYSVVQSDGASLQTWLVAHGNTAPSTIPFPSARLAAQADELASFSLLGPATIDVVKPDVQAPGVAILAAVANNGTANGPNTVALFSGTSMATPHTTGSGALLAGLHPDWTPAEIKSALMMTALEDGLAKPDGTTPSDAFDRGSGRLQDFQANSAGLVLDETADNFAAADPANSGDPGTLNLASMQSANCVTVDGSTSTATCSFTRTFRSTQDHSVTWTASFSGVSATALPAALPVGSLATAGLTVTVDASSYNSDGAFHFGEMVLTPDDATLAPLHLPIAVKVPPPTIAASPSPVIISIPNGNTTSGAPLTVTNVGGPTLSVTNTNDNTSLMGATVVLDQASQGNDGFYSDLFTDFAHGFYAADDFQTVAVSTNLSKLSFPGFMTGATPLSELPGTKIHFQVFADNAGIPNGNPETVAPSYVYSFVATIGTTNGLNVANDTISIDLNAAGAPGTALPPGRYWIVVWPELVYANGPWAWFESETTFGYNAHNIDPAGLGGGSTAWTDNTSSGGFPGMAIHMEGFVPCGAPWISTTPSTLTLDGKLSDTVTVTADSTQFPVPGPGTATAFVCLDSNDAATPVLAVKVTATQN
jgi:hypothetical protein